MEKKNGGKIQLSPPQLLVVVFLFSIVIGTFFLKLPFSTKEPISWIDALFTATSAMTVTGLVTVDPGTVFTPFGQLVIAFLIQIGGLGIMSFAVLIIMVLGKKIGIKERILIQHQLNQTSIGGVIRLVKYLFIFSFLIEFVAMLILSIKWVPQFGWEKGLFYSFFHAISAYNNAGFALWKDNLMQFVGDPVVILVISFLFILGGIGFPVLVDIWTKKTFKKLSLHTKIMIIGTLIVNVAATVFILLIEFHNPKTLEPLTWGEKILAAYFQAVSPRTAGFNSIDIGAMEDSSLFFISLLMFIGAGSASTGGGIKLSTAIVIIFSVLAFLKGRTEINLLKRSIGASTVIRALAVTMSSIVFIIAAVLILNITERQPFLHILFEVVSAFGTTGLSAGITGSLTFIGKIIIIFMMFLGKVGSLTLLFILSSKEQQKIRYPSEDVLTG
ncbi:TrkH family potassium uptake protein [Aeribacillus sp. FSL M8-0254]|uniref:TrkH family potassium uptake protein n=1 Tax=Aeribacillus sp. FSL M8-0254 TaxID=2954577 RepID=UPI0030F7D7FD